MSAASRLILEAFAVFAIRIRQRRKESGVVQPVVCTIRRFRYPLLEEGENEIFFVL